MFCRRKAILMIHGFVGGNYDYGNFGNELELHRQFDVYNYTLPGHEKAIVKDVKYTDWIDESINQIEFLIKNGYREIYLIGHSMGGVIAAHLASIYPQVKKLVLVAPAFKYFYFKDGAFNIKGLNETLKNLPSLMKSMGTDTVIDRITKTPIPTMIEFTKLVNTYANSVENITCPTLIIRGNNDQVVPAESTDYVYNVLKSKTNILINIDSVTHDCFTKLRNQEVRDTITKFLLKRSKKKKEIINI